MARDYSKEPPICEADRAKARKSAAQFHYQTQYALTILCTSEGDQAKLHEQLTKRYPDRRVRVVVS